MTDPAPKVIQAIQVVQVVPVVRAKIAPVAHQTLPMSSMHSSLGLRPLKISNNVL